MAQLYPADSVRWLVSQSPESEADARYKLCTKIMGSHDSLFLELIERQIKQEQKKTDKKQLKNLYWWLGSYYQTAAQLNRAQNSLEKALGFASEASEKSSLLLHLAHLKITSGRYLEALEYLRQAKIAIYNREFYPLESEIQLEEAFCYIQLLNYDAAAARLTAAGFTLQLTENRFLKAKRLSYLGYLHSAEKDYLNAQAFLMQAFSLWKQDTLNADFALASQQLAGIYKAQYKYALASHHAQRAQHIFDSLRLPAGSAGSRLFLVSLANNPDSSVHQLLTQAKNIFENTQHTSGQIESYIALAKYFNQQNLSDSALHYLNRAEEFFPLVENQKQQLNFNLAKSSYYLKHYRPDSALILAKKGLHFALASGDWEQKADAYAHLADLYKITKDFRQAFQNLTLAHAYKDSLAQLSASFELKKLQESFEAKRQESLIQHLTNERNQQNQTIEKNIKRLEKQQATIYLIAIVLLLILLIALLMGAFLHYRKKDNKRLALRNKQIAQQKEEIEVQRQHLEDINQELEKLSLIARQTDNGIRIMNEVGRITWVNEGYVKMHGYTLEELQEIGRFDLLGEEANINIQQLVSVWYGDKKPISFESLVKNKWGNEMWVQTTLTPILDENQKIEKMIAIESDITRIKKAEQEIRTKNLDITASISYAKRIQEAMMTPFSVLSTVYPDSFCFYQPKSIVSGDFYWMTNKHDRLIVACADSTGHGVPGAFMSLIGMSFLNKIVNEKGFVSPAIILNRLRMNIISHLHQTNGENLAGDGMDISVISIDLKNNYLEFAGAMNPVIILRNKDLIELKADRMPVGFFDNEDRPFSSTSLNLQANDQIYLFTDGYYDQFGGKNGSKMKSQRFRDILLRCAFKSSEEQKTIIEDSFNAWKGEYPQVDDVLLMGIHIN
ncbi:MAG: SpoIIE family protein phosphatase [Salinivirgaceae bacterium]